MKLFEKTLTSETKFEGRIIKVLRDTVELENGKTSAREVVCHNGGVCVAALTEQNEVLLVRQFRYPYKEVLLELPAGKLEKGEDPFEAVKREQMEETGTTGENYISLGQSVPLSRLLRRDHRIWACRVAQKGEIHLDEDEFLEVERIPLDKAVEMVLNNEIPEFQNAGGHFEDRRARKGRQALRGAHEKNIHHATAEQGRCVFEGYAHCGAVRREHHARQLQ